MLPSSLRAKTLGTITLAGALTLAAGCGEQATEPGLDATDAQDFAAEGSYDNDSFGSYDGPTTYEVTIENLTAGQPFSPVVAATHKSTVRFWQNRRYASPQIEAIAEDGNQAPMVALLEELQKTTGKITDVVDVGMPVNVQGSDAGGFSDRVTFTIQANRGDRLSLAGMLICTNDGFMGLNGHYLNPRTPRTLYVRGYDAGTEENTEASTDIVDACSALGPVALPGDPNGNENDAVDTPGGRIGRHRGITGKADLLLAHNWKGNVAKVTIKPVRTPVRYQVTFENLTDSQPFSPVVAATHDPSVNMFRLYRPASGGLEAIAENGDNSLMFNRFDTIPEATQAVNTGAPLTRAGTTVGDFTSSVTFEIEADENDVFSLATMLICSNDGFTGVSNVRLPHRGTRYYYTRGYDAGTENNTERSTDIVDACSALGALNLPGDPNGNENDAVDTTRGRRIQHHRGIQGNGDLTRDDHDWSGPVGKLTITRIESGP